MNYWKAENINIAWCYSNTTEDWYNLTLNFTLSYNEEFYIKYNKVLKEWLASWLQNEENRLVRLKLVKYFSSPLLRTLRQFFFCTVWHSSMHSNIERNKARSILTPKLLLLTWNYWPTSGRELEISNEDKTKFLRLQQHHKTPDFWLKDRWLDHMKRIFVFYLLRKKNTCYTDRKEFSVVLS